MSDMKCPFCGKRLDAVVKNQNDWIYSCGNPSCEFFDDCDNYEKKHYLATPEFWQELIRTRKALDIRKKQVEIANKSFDFINTEWDNIDCSRKELGACAFNAKEDIAGWESDIETEEQKDK